MSNTARPPLARGRAVVEPARASRASSHPDQEKSLSGRATSSRMFEKTSRASRLPMRSVSRSRALRSSVGARRIVPCFGCERRSFETLGRERARSCHRALPGPTRAAPYGLSRMAPAFELVNLAEQIQKADETLGMMTGGKLGVIAEQIRRLQEKAHSILEKARRDAELHARAARSRSARAGRVTSTERPTASAGSRASLRTSGSGVRRCLRGDVPARARHVLHAHRRGRGRGGGRGARGPAPR